MHCIDLFGVIVRGADTVAGVEYVSGQPSIILANDLLKYTPTRIFGCHFLDASLCMRVQ